MIQAFGGCNSDPDSWDVFNDLIAYGTGPCVLVQNLTTFQTVSFIPLSFGIITCVRFDSTGMLIIGTSNGNVFLLDPITKEVFSLQTFESSITHCSVFKDDILISTAVNGLRYIKRHFTPDNNSNLTVEQALFPDLRCVSLNLTRFNGVLIFGLGHPDGTIQLYVPSTQSSVTLEGFAWSLSLQFNPINDKSILFAAAGQDKTIRLWKISLDIASEISKLNVSVSSHATLETESTPFHVELFANLEGHSDWINSISFCPGPTHAFSSASFDGQVLIWKPDMTLSSNDSNYSDYDISIRLGTTNVADDQSGFIGCKLINDNDVIALARSGGFSRWIDGQSTRCFAGHFDGVTGLSWTTIGCFISVALDNTARVYGIDHGTYRELARPLIHGHAIFDVGEISDDKYAFVSDEKNVRILQPSQCFYHIHPVPQLANKQLPFASMIQALSLDNTIIPDAESVEALFHPLTAADFMKDRIPDSHEMWLTRWPEFKSSFGHHREIHQMTIPEKGDWFATGDDKGGYIIYGKKDLERRHKYEKDPTKSLTTAIAASPDATLLVQGLENGTIKIIDPVTCSIMKTIGSDDGLYGLGWSRNSQYFAIGGVNGLNIYEREGLHVASYPEAGFVTAIDYIDDNTMIIGTDQGELKKIYYNPSEQTFTEQCQYQKHGGRVTDIKINHQLQQFLSGAMDHAVLLHQLNI